MLSRENSRYFPQHLENMPFWEVEDGIIALPAIVANVAWQWMMERGIVFLGDAVAAADAAGFEPEHTP